MKYKGENKFYWQIGIFRDWERFKYRRFIFRFFFLRKKPPEVEILKFWENYIGINYQSKGWYY